MSFMHQSKKDTERHFRMIKEVDLDGIKALHQRTIFGESADECYIFVAEDVSTIKENDLKRRIRDSRQCGHVRAIDLIKSDDFVYVELKTEELS